MREYPARMQTFSVHGWSIGGSARRCQALKHIGLYAKISQDKEVNRVARGQDIMTTPDMMVRTEGMLAFIPLFNYLYCLLASTVLVERPLLGGALYMAAQVTASGSRLLRRDALKTLRPVPRISLLALSALCLVLSLGLLLVYPFSVNLPLLWVLFAVIILVRTRFALVLRLHRYGERRNLSRAQRLVRLVELELGMATVLALILFLSQPTDTSWYLLGGYILTSVLEGYAITASPVAKSVPPASSDPADIAAALSKVNAIRTFRLASSITLTALQVSMILIYTLIAVTAGDLLLCMGIAFVFTYAPSRITQYVLRSQRNQQRDPTNVLLVGLSLWLVSLVMLAQHLLREPGLWAYATLAACTAGTTVAVSALRKLDGGMQDVIQFATGTRPGHSMDFAREAQASFSSMAGQMIALIGLCLVVFFSESIATISLQTLQPSLLIPAAVLVVAALLAAFRLPLDKQVAQKLHRFLLLKDNGETNLPLQKQLEDRIIKVNHRHYGIKLVMLVLRPFFYIKLQGKDNVRLDRDIACIFACNHGELYGPIVTNLYIPYSFRPWVISEMTDREEVADYIYTFTVKRQRWLPEGLKQPISNLLAPFLAWIMHSIESIPVYRNDPRKLILTLRDSAAAMEAGDNLLIFPENPNPHGEQQGYLQDGIGEFFSGFVTVAQLYERRTGKCAQFYPLYADKKNRLLTFGLPIRYNPDNVPADEQHRVSDHLRSEMMRISGLDAGMEG